MSSATLEQLIDACLDGDVAARSALEGALRQSPEARRAWWRAVQVHAGVQGALRARAAAMSGARMRKASPRRRRAVATFPQRWVLVAAAALILVALGLLTRQPAAPPTAPSTARSTAKSTVQPVVVGLARITAGTGVGRDLSAGDDVLATSATTIAFTGEATTVRLASGARLRVDRPHGLALTLASGVMLIDAAPQPVDHPLRVTTPHAELRVIGTAFQVSVGQATELRVDHGTVALRSASDEVRVGAGGEARCRPGETPRHGGRLLRQLEEGHVRSDRLMWNNNSRGGIELLETKDGFLDDSGCLLRLRPDRDHPSPWAGMRFPVAQDWRDATGISFALKGSGQGGVLLFEILDDGPPSRLGELDHAERFAVEIRDERSGWREWRIPFTTFQRRQMQHPGAADDGFSLSAVQGLTLIHHTAPLEIVIDRIGLYRE